MICSCVYDLLNTGFSFLLELLCFTLHVFDRGCNQKCLPAALRLLSKHLAGVMSQTCERMDPYVCVSQTSWRYI